MRMELAAIMATALLSGIPAFSANAPSCRVNASIREVGKAGAKGADTLITLQSNQSIQLDLQIANKGQRKDFTVKMLSSGVDVLDGPTSRNATVAESASQAMRVGLRGAELKGPCVPGLRHVEFTVYSRQEPERICGSASAYFLCSESEAAPAAIPAQGASTPSVVDTEAVAGPESGAPRAIAARITRKDTLVHPDEVKP